MKLFNTSAKMQGAEDTLMHMLSDCPKIQEFWAGISTQIEFITSRKIPFPSKLCVLGDPSLLLGISHSDAEWSQTVLMLGHKLIV